MMKGVIRLGDKTNHNGCVLTASKTIVVRGKGVARIGDMVSCPKDKHGPTHIIEGDPNITDKEGVLVKYGTYFTPEGKAQMEYTHRKRQQLT